MVWVLIIEDQPDILEDLIDAIVANVRLFGNWDESKEPYIRIQKPEDSFLVPAHDLWNRRDMSSVSSPSSDQCSIKIYGAWTVQGANKLVGTEKEAPALISLDIMLRGANIFNDQRSNLGDEPTSGVARLFAKARWIAGLKNSRVIILSAFLLHYQTQLEQAGVPVSNMMAKPFSFYDLTALLEQVLSSK